MTKLHKKVEEVISTISKRSKKTRQNYLDRVAFMEVTLTAIAAWWGVLIWRMWRRAP